MSIQQTIYELKQVAQQLKKVSETLQRLLDKYGTGVEEHTVIKELEDVTSAVESLARNIGDRSNPEPGSLIARVGSEQDESSLIGKLKQMVDRLGQLLDKYGTGVEEHTVIKELEDVTSAVESLARNIGDRSNPEPGSLIERINDLSVNRIGSIDSPGTLNYFMNILSSIVTLRGYRVIREVEVDSAYYSPKLCVAEEYIYTATTYKGMLVKLDKGLNIVDMIGSPTYIDGICWDGYNLWILYSVFVQGSYVNYIGRFDWETGEISNQFPVDADVGLAFDGQCFWAGSSSGMIYRYDISGNVVSSFDSMISPCDLCIVGDELWISNGMNGRVYRFGFDGYLKGVTSIGGIFVEGISYDERSGMIYASGEGKYVCVEERGSINVYGIDEIRSKLSRINVDQYGRVAVQDPYFLDVPVSTRASESTLVEIRNMFLPVSSSGSVQQGQATGLVVSLDTGGRPYVEVYYSVSGPAVLYVECSTDGTYWYTTDVISTTSASSETIMYINAFRYVRVRCPTTGISITIVISAAR
ncbi:MAG: hypothetical protein QXZ17_01915 [Nitrososphaerota archaeon]